MSVSLRNSHLERRLKIFSCPGSVASQTPTQKMFLSCERFGDTLIKGRDSVSHKTHFGNAVKGASLSGVMHHVANTRE